MYHSYRRICVILFFLHHRRDKVFNRFPQLRVVDYERKAMYSGRRQR